MATIIGTLTFNDTDRVFASTPGQTSVWDAVQQEIAKHNAELAAASSIFIQGETEAHKTRYYLPAGGYMQERGGQARSAAVKRYGKWDIALPLKDFGDQVAGDNVILAYMTAAELRNHLDGIMVRDKNTLRREILRRLFRNSQDTVVDELHGSLSIEGLANGDAVVYPPVLGSDAEATDDHYLESGYLYTAISNTNNPLVTMRNELEEHFGASTGGDNIVTFWPSVVIPYLEALTDYDPVNDRFIQPGANTDLPYNWPYVPGRVVGRSNGCWVVEWRWVPTAATPYGLGIYLDPEVPPPLLQRVDPADTGLPRGLALVAEDADYPWQSSHYQHRFGVGAGNRLNGVVMELAAGAGYTIPTPYA